MIIHTEGMNGLINPYGALTFTFYQQCNESNKSTCEPDHIYINLFAINVNLGTSQGQKAITNLATSRHNYISIYVTQ